MKKEKKLSKIMREKSLTLKHEKTIKSLISLISGINIKKMEKGLMDKDDWAKIVKAAKQLKDLPIFIK